MTAENKKQRIFQAVPTYSVGDAVGNEVTAMDEVLRREGYETCIYVDNVHPGIDPGRYRRLWELPTLNPDDIMIYHLSIACPFSYQFAQLPCKKMIVYHNITPPEFFRKYNIAASYACAKGLEQTRFLADKADYCIADSAWNKNDLIEMGYTCPIDIMPVMIPFEDFNREPDGEVLQRYRNAPGANILFTGRVAPNKCQHDVIEAFYYYKRDYDPDARLFIVGGYGSSDPYYLSLLAYIDEIGVKDVIFPGHISFEAILAYYRLADVFLCQSEHEGFCVPLVEAMIFKTPIVAFNSTAVGQTMAGGGILLDEKDPLLTSRAIDCLMRDEGLRNRILSNQEERLKSFDYAHLQEEFLGYIQHFAKG